MGVNSVCGLVANGRRRGSSVILKFLFPKEKLILWARGGGGALREWVALSLIRLVSSRH